MGLGGDSEFLVNSPVTPVGLVSELSGEAGADSDVSLFMGDEGRFRSQTNQGPAQLLFNMSAVVSYLQAGVRARKCYTRL